MDAAQKEDLVIAVYRNKKVLFELAYDILCGVEEDILNFMDNINPVLREDGKTYAYVLVIPYRQGFPNNKNEPTGFIFPAAFRFQSVNIFTQRENRINKVRLKMPSFGAHLVADFIDDFKVHRGTFSNALKPEVRFKAKIDITRWMASEHFGVHYHDVTGEQYTYQKMFELAVTLNREMKSLGLTVDKGALRDFLISNASALPEEPPQKQYTLKDILEAPNETEEE